MVPLILIVSFGISAVSALAEKKGIEIVAHAGPMDDSTFVLRGSVLTDSGPISNAKVWAVLRDLRGGSASPPAVTTGPAGGFEMESLPLQLGESDITQASLYTRVTQGDDGQAEPLRGEATVNITSTGSFRTVTLSAWALAFLPAIFLVSIVVPFIPGAPGQIRYVFTILMAFLFTVGMVASISMGLQKVNSTGTRGDVLSMGFASMFRGSYVDGVQEEWLFSFTEPNERFVLTAPREAAPTVLTLDTTSAAGAVEERKQQDEPASGEKAALIQGFGAPLWVLLLAVYGAGLLTVAMIVSEIQNKPTAADPQKLPDEYRKRMGKVVRHQFYILFAPIGAVFVYQLLVMSDAAAKPVTVALAALGAGASMNLLLEQAVKYTKNLIEKSP
jgi:hypothetical protein